MSKISLQRHLFIAAFAYDLKKQNKSKNTLTEISHLIPIISLPSNTSKFIYSLKDRMKWESNVDLKRFAFEDEFSNYHLFRYAVQAVGLAILFVPIRLLATKMKSYDEKRGRTCPYDSPYHPSLDSSYVPTPHIKRHTTNQMLDFTPLKKFDIDPEQLMEDVELRIEFNRWKSTQVR